MSELVGRREELEVLVRAAPIAAELGQHRIALRRWNAVAGDLDDR